MKNNNINFFESPNPRHFNFNNFHDEKFNHFQDHEIHEEKLFATPIAVPKPIKMCPFPMMDPFITSPNLISKRKNYQEMQEQHSLQEQAQFSFHGIQQKIEFSQEQQQEQLLVPITPLKIKKMEQVAQAPATIRKYFPVMVTPVTETKIYQRGLKKLAAQAYRFVTHQKRTTYKQVAKRLIEQLGEDGDIDVNKKGEMNIKRRVYDALNVLIALGLLRRNGNRIYSKKVHYEQVSGDNDLQRQRQIKREEALQKELNCLRQTYQKRMQIMNAKKTLQVQIKQKIQIFRSLQNKNLRLQNQSKLLQQKLQFPLLLVSFIQEDKKAQLKYEHRHAKKYQSNQQSSPSTLSMWQTNDSDLYCSFNNNKKKKLSLMGQLDFLTHLKTEEQKPMPERNERPKRRR